MKKLITICVFALGFLLSTQTISAQQTKSLETVAKEKTYKLTQEFGLDGNQQRMIWRAFLNKEKAYQEIAEGNYTAKEIENIKVKVEDMFMSTMKEQLSAKQLEKFELVKKDY